MLEGHLGQIGGTVQQARESRGLAPEVRSEHQHLRRDLRRPQVHSAHIPRNIRPAGQEGEEGNQGVARAVVQTVGDQDLQAGILQVIRAVGGAKVLRPGRRDQQSQRITTLQLQEYLHPVQTLNAGHIHHGARY